MRMIVLLFALLVSYSCGYYMPVTFEKEYMETFKGDEQWRDDDEPVYMKPLGTTEGHDDSDRPKGGEHTGFNRILNTIINMGKVLHVTGETGDRRPTDDERTVNIEEFFDKMEAIKTLFGEIVKSEGTKNKIVGVMVFLDEIVKLKKEYEEKWPKDGTGRRPNVSDLDRFVEKIKDLKKVFIDDDMGNKYQLMSGGERFDLRVFFDKMKDLKKKYEDKIRTEMLMGLRPEGGEKTDLQIFFDKVMELKNVYESTIQKDVTGTIY